MFPGETIRTGASPVCEDCKVELKMQILKSNAGYYVGTACQCGPYSRESGYYASRQELEIAWKNGSVEWRDLQT